MSYPSWIEKLQSRWQVKSAVQVIIILVVFACTGLTVMFIKPHITGWLFENGHSTWFSILYWVMIIPVYNFFLLFYGFILGYFKFFWEFEKRFFGRILGKRKVKSEK